MASGTYGTIKPANISSNDVDILYHYKPNRSYDSTDFSKFKKLNSNLLNNTLVEDSVTSLTDKTMTGMYNLKLPLDVFNQKGIYTIYIRPKEIITTISDVGVLAAYGDVRGVILKNSGLSSSLTNDGSLVGYRIEYFKNDKRTDTYRIITSNNKCEPINGVATDPNQKSIRYRYSDAGSLMFCTVTPSSAVGFKSNTLPYIGATDDTIALINTKFNPVMIEVEMVDKDIETLTNMLEGDQLRDLDSGLITTYNDKQEIYKQVEIFTVKDKYTGAPLYDVKAGKKDGIDYTQDIKEITNDI